VSNVTKERAAVLRVIASPPTWADLSPSTSLGRVQRSAGALHPRVIEGMRHPGTLAAGQHAVAVIVADSVIEQVERRATVDGGADPCTDSPCGPALGCTGRQATDLLPPSR
jgi:hypothetical protein